MATHGKKYQEAAKLVDPGKAYSLTQAVDLVKKGSYAKFACSIDLHLNTNLDPRQADQQLRGTVVLPSGSGKSVRILVFAEGEAAAAATAAGADYVGSDDLVQKIQGGWFDFDVAIATPQTMGKAGRLGKVLGPRGLMPNPKTGTVVTPENLGRAIAEARQGRVEYRLDKTANIHVAIGKSTFTNEQLSSNLTAVMEAIVRARPSGVKGIYIKKITIAPTMGPGIKLDLNEAMSVKAA
jgi:large subunit ribosomal protein L1